MELKEGQYYYAPHRSQWGVWRREPTVNGVSGGQFIADFPTKIQARNFVYKMNGWNTESKI